LKGLVAVFSKSSSSIGKELRSTLEAASRSVNAPSIVQVRLEPVVLTVAKARTAPKERKRSSETMLFSRVDSHPKAGFVWIEQRNVLLKKTALTFKKPY